MLYSSSDKKYQKVEKNLKVLRLDFLSPLLQIHCSNYGNKKHMTNKYMEFLFIYEISSKVTKIY